MARKIICDRCRDEHELASAAANTAEWSSIKVTKLDNEGAVIEKKEVCAKCTAALRRWFQQPDVPNLPQE